MRLVKPHQFRPETAIVAFCLFVSPTLALKRNYTGSQLALEINALGLSFQEAVDETISDPGDTLRLTKGIGGVLGTSYSPELQLACSYGFQAPFYVETGIAVEYAKVYVASYEQLVPPGFIVGSELRTLHVHKLDFMWLFGAGSSTWDFGRWIEVRSGRYAGRAIAYGATKLGLIGGFGFTQVLSQSWERPKYYNPFGTSAGDAYPPERYTDRFAGIFPRALGGMRVNGSGLGPFAINMILGCAWAPYGSPLLDFQGFFRIGLSYLFLDSKRSVRYSDPR